MDFSNLQFDLIDITTNATPDLFVNLNGVTFTRKVVSDLGFPANVQYSINAEHGIIAMKPCKGNESKASAFSKPEKEQTKTITTTNPNLREVMTNMIPNYNPKKRYKIVGQFDAEKHIMYFDMTTAEISDFKKGKDDSEE
jgi:hypothetical protein